MLTGSRGECSIYQRAELSLNGPEGSVAATKVESVKLLKWGFKRMKRNLDMLGYDNTSLLNCMTLDDKNQVSTALQYARDFGSTVKEGLKRTASW